MNTRIEFSNKIAPQLAREAVVEHRKQSHGNSTITLKCREAFGRRRGGEVVEKSFKVQERINGVKNTLTYVVSEA